MTLNDFQQLCHDQWMQPSRGDVIELRLGAASAAELALGVLTTDGPENSWFLQRMDKADLKAIAAAAKVREVANPITRSAVTITVGVEDSADMALVHFGSHAEDKLIAL